MSKKIERFLDTHDHRNTLVTLLSTLEWNGPLEWVDLKDLTPSDKATLMLTCCGSMILALAHLMCGGDRDNMINVIDTLVDNMKKQAGKVPKEMLN